MTVVLLGKGLVLRASPSKIEVIGALGVYSHQYSQQKYTDKPKLRSFIWSNLFPEHQLTSIHIASCRCKHPKMTNSYCWWFRNPAHQLRLVVHPVIYRVLYMPGGAGFLPSTVLIHLIDITDHNPTASSIQSLNKKYSNYIPQNSRICTLKNNFDFITWKLTCPLKTGHPKQETRIPTIIFTGAKMCVSGRL